MKMEMAFEEEVRKREIKINRRGKPGGSLEMRQKHQTKGGR